MTPRGYYLAYKILKRRIDLSSDGCSGAPDFNFKECCVEHDYYYRNPIEVTGMSRADADRKLRECIKFRGGSIVSWAYWIAVRSFGWIPWNKAGKAAKKGDVSKLHPTRPRHLKKANVFAFTDKEGTVDDYDY